jgi:anti-anti-sigma factor
MNHHPPATVAIHLSVVHEHVTRVHVEGEIDILTAPQLEAALRAEIDQGRDVVLDLSAVSFIDSTGLHAIVSAAHAASACGQQLRVHSVMGSQARKLFEVTRLERLLPTAP